MARNVKKNTPARAEAIEELRRIAGPLADQAVDAYESLSCYKDDMGESPFRFYWHLGMHTRKIVDAESAQAASAGKKPNHKASRTLAKMLDEPATNVRYAGYVFDSFPAEKQLEKLIGLRRADGKPLAFWVVATLCTPVLLSRQAALIKQACDNNWSETDAKDFLRAEREPNGKTPAAKAPKLPASLAVGLVRWERDANDMLRYGEAIFKDEVINDLLSSVEAGAVTPERVDSVVKTFEALQVEIARRLPMLQKIAERRAKDTAVVPQVVAATVAVTPAQVPAAPAPAPAPAPVAPAPVVAAVQPQATVSPAEPADSSKEAVSARVRQAIVAARSKPQMAAAP